MSNTNRKQLTAELQSLRNSFETNGRSAADSKRMDDIRKTLNKAAR